MVNRRTDGLDSARARTRIDALVADASKWQATIGVRLALALTSAVWVAEETGQTAARGHFILVDTLGVRSTWTRVARIDRLRWRSLSGCKTKTLQFRNPS